MNGPFGMAIYFPLHTNQIFAIVFVVGYRNVFTAKFKIKIVEIPGPEIQQVLVFPRYKGLPSSQMYLKGASSHLSNYRLYDKTVKQSFLTWRAVVITKRHTIDGGITIIITRLQNIIHTHVPPLNRTVSRTTTAAENHA